jgi:signal transduction histidine kinase
MSQKPNILIAWGGGERENTMWHPPQILYYGSDAERIAGRCTADSPFELASEPVTTDARSVLSRTDTDCLVVHGDESVVRPVIERVRESEPQCAVVVFSTADDPVGLAALEGGVTHYVAVDDDFDPVEGLDALGPVVERHRQRRRQRTMIDSLLEHVPLSIYFKDRKSRHVRASEEITSLAEPDPPYIQNVEGKRHHTATDVLGKTDFDLHETEHAAQAIEDDRRVMETEEPIRNKVEGPFGERRSQTYISASKAPWYDEEGNVIGIVGITQDISERKQYEHQLERQNERLERLTSVISHDLRNPLDVALGRVELARESDDPEHIDSIEHSLRRMNALIDDLLTLASEGEAVDDPTSISLGQLATDAWEVVKSEGATLRVESEARLLADESRLRQLLENLFRNAVEHGSTDPRSQTHDSPPETTVTVGDLDDGEGFFLADDGPGIPADRRDEVFESGHTTSDDGTGLGLSIVRTIAEAHGWTVTLEESADGGARFEFTGVVHPS